MKKLLKEKINNKKAITLISLVVTIVVLVILAAVAINMAIGNNGLFNKTKLAKEDYVNSSEKEKSDIDILTNDISSIAGSREGLSESQIREIVRQELAATSGFSKEVLWSGTKTDTGSVTLSKSINEFDAVYVLGQYYGSASSYNQALGTLIFKEDYEVPTATSDSRIFTFILNASITDNNRRITFDFTGSNKNELTIGTIISMRLLKVYGINF